MHEQLFVSEFKQLLLFYLYYQQSTVLNWCLQYVCVLYTSVIHTELIATATQDPPPHTHTEHYCFLKLSHEGLQQLSTHCVGIKECKRVFQQKAQQKKSCVHTESLRVFLFLSLSFNLSSNNTEIVLYYTATYCTIKSGQVIVKSTICSYYLLLSKVIQYLS